MNSDYTTKLLAGTVFPDITATLLSGEPVNLAKPKAGFDWKLVLVYRGKHCPLCTRNLNQLEQFKGALTDIGIDIVAVFGDSKTQLEAHRSN